MMKLTSFKQIKSNCDTSWNRKVYGLYVVLKDFQAYVKT